MVLLISLPPRHGPNAMPEPLVRPAWLVLLSQLRSPLICILIAAAVLVAACRCHAGAPEARA